MKNLKNRMKDLDVSQVDLIFHLRKKGYDVQPPQLSQIINGVYTYPKAKIILEKIEEILNEIDNARN